MKATLKSYYRKPGGLLVFVFAVTGTKEELAAYKAAQGDKHRIDEDTKEVLWFSTRSNGCKRGSSVDLTITKNGNVVCDDLDKILMEEDITNVVYIKEMAKLKARQALMSGGMSGLAGLAGIED